MKRRKKKKIVTPESISQHIGKEFKRNKEFRKAYIDEVRINKGKGFARRNPKLKEIRALIFIAIFLAIYWGFATFLCIMYLRGWKF